MPVFCGARTDRRASKIGTITPGGPVTEYSVSSSSGPAEIAAGPDGNLWFTAAASGKVGRMDLHGSYTLFTPADTPESLDSLSRAGDGTAVTHALGEVPRFTYSSELVQTATDPPGHVTSWRSSAVTSSATVREGFGVFT